MIVRMRVGESWWTDGRVLFTPSRKRISWATRLRVAYRALRGKPIYPTGWRIENIEEVAAQ